MKSVYCLIVGCAVLTAASTTGCGSSGPATPAAVGGGHVSGSPLDRIKSIESNAALSPEEKQRRISAIKERNHLN